MDRDPEARVSVPARPEYGRILGLVADAVAADQGLDADKIDDLGVAVDEVAAILTDLAGVDRVTLSVELDGPMLRCDVEGEGDVQGTVQLDDLRTTVLSAVTDAIELDQSEPRVGLLISKS